MTCPSVAAVSTAASMPFILDEIVGGWKVGMTGVVYTGFPVNIIGNQQLAAPTATRSARITIAS